MNGNTAWPKAPYKNIPGNHPSTTILLHELTPATLGSLLCLYEHRCFVQGHIWNINSFDQWGVELGKNLSKIISGEFHQGKDNNVTHDSSTERLISYCLNKSESS